jgi:drug/metabolite transporter (DMT)-like permease
MDATGNTAEQMPLPESGSGAPGAEETRGLFLVAASAIVWSFGGTIARFIEVPDAWTMVFWRASSAALFLLAFMTWYYGFTGSLRLFRAMGLPGFIVGCCFAIASTSFVVALQYTTVANILLMQAGVPLIAALFAWILFRESVAPATWAAIFAVITGVAVMVSDSLTGSVSPVGDGLSLLIALSFAVATVITRRYAHVRMTPAVFLGTLISATISAALAGGFAVGARDAGLLWLFGAFNLGLGMALFATGARLIPSAVAALVGTLETMLGPLWVWLIHGETPAPRTIIGGLMILAALIAHILWQMVRQRRVSPLPPL